MARVSKVESLRRQGFDRSYYAGGHPAFKAWKVRCSQCEALVINGVPSHERGCPNIPKPEEDDDGVR